MRNIVLIGASGFVGSALLTEALNRNIRVTAVVRNPEKITQQHPNLTVVQVDVSDVDQLAAVSKGKDAVLSAYNPGWARADNGEETLKVYPMILEGVKKAGVQRLLVVGGAGTLLVQPGLRLVDSGKIPVEIIEGVRALGMFYLDTLLPEQALDWVFFSPAAHLIEGERTGIYRLGKDDLLVDEKGNSTISVQDYAKAMIDELETPAHHKERFTIGY